MLDPAIVRHQIDALRASFPDLECDEEGWLLALESETDIDELLLKLIERLDEAAIMAGGIATRIAELEVRQERFIHRQRSIRNAMLALMQAAGIKSKETPLATLSVRAGAKKVVINDDASVPDILCRIKREPDKAKIKQMLLDGAAVNWAHLETGEQTLAVRK